MYKFYIGEMLLPITPSNVELNIQNNNTTVNLINDGDINILKNPGLTEIEFEFILPAKRYHFAQYPNNHFIHVRYYLGYLESLKLYKKPFSFKIIRDIYNGELFDTNMDCTIEEYSIIEDAEELGFDVKVQIKLKQYKTYGTKVFNVNQTSTPSTPTSVPTSVPTSATGIPVTETNKRATKDPATTYTVKAGDTLYAICKRELGDGNKYKEIAELNNIKNPNLIQVGQVIRLVKKADVKKNTTPKFEPSKPPYETIGAGAVSSTHVSSSGRTHGGGGGAF